MTVTAAQQRAKGSTKHAGGPPRICETPEIMQERVDDYFEQDGLHTMTGLALHLGFCTRVSFLTYGETVPQFLSTIARARARVEAEYEEWLRHEKGSQQGSVFALMNMGWKTQHDVTSDGRAIAPVVHLVLAVEGGQVRPAALPVMSQEVAPALPLPTRTESEVEAPRLP